MAIIVVATAIPAPEHRDAAVAAHMKSGALAELGVAIRGKLTGPLDVQMLTPHPAGSAEKGAL